MLRHNRNKFSHFLLKSKLQKHKGLIDFQKNQPKEKYLNCLASTAFIINPKKKQFQNEFCCNASQNTKNVVL